MRLATGNWFFDFHIQSNSRIKPMCERAGKFRIAIQLMETE